MSQEQGLTNKVNIEKKYCPKCYQQYEGSAQLCPDDGSILRGAKNDPLIGKVFADKYEVQSVLGLGGMSIVYKAHHKLMDRSVAIKMLHKNLKEDILALERFRVEAQAAALLNHQNIISVYDFGVTDDGEPYFIMDCLEGESLKELIDRKGKVPYQRALPIFRQICEGLDAAHKKGIVHRDLKPANVVLIKEEDGTEQVKLVDFGIAKLLPQSGKEQQHLTQTGEVFGSPIYMSPEQCLGRDLDTRSDIYALGCLMYETLSGDPPFLGDSFLETMNKHVGEEAKPLAKALPDEKIPDALDQVILQCMSKKPEERFQSAGEIRDLISSITVAAMGSSGKIGSLSTSTVTLPCPEMETQKRKQKATLGVAAVFFLLFSSVIGICAFAPGPAEDRGTPLNKLWWQSCMNFGDMAAENRDYSGAQGYYNQAVAKARTFGDGHARLVSALKKECDLYTKWEGHAEDLERVNTEIVNLQAESVVTEYDDQMRKLEGFLSDSKSPVARTDNKLKAEAQTPSILATAGKLQGRNMESKLETLLRKAIQVDSQLLGKDSLVVAQLDSKLADALISQRKVAEVRVLLADACSILKNKSDEFPEYLRCLNKLGQFDLDQNDFANAKKELGDALRLTKDLNVHVGLRPLILRNYANLMRQCGEPGGAEKAKALLKEADEIEKKYPQQ